MSSTTGSEILLSAENLALEFRVQRYPSTTLREAFVRMCSPWRHGGGHDTKRIEVIRDVSFELTRGQRVALLGRNGSGKTSLCRCLAGIYRPGQGTLRTQGQIKALFGAIALIEAELTGRENARAITRLLYPEIREIDPIVNAAMEFSELGEYADLKARYYSNGMRARLSLSLAISKPADILILDEAFEGADHSFNIKAMNRIKQMIQESGAAIIVSHSMDLVRELCNCAWVYEDGAITYSGELEEGIRRYLDGDSRISGSTGA